MTDFPTPVEELERKTRQLLVDTLSAVDAGTITPMRGVVRMETAWALVAGVLSRELQDDVAEAHEALRQVVIQNRRR